MKKLFAVILSVLLCFSCFVGYRVKEEDGEDVLRLTIQDEETEIILNRKLATAFENSMKAQGRNITVKRTTISGGEYDRDVMNLYNTDTLGDVLFTIDSHAAQYSSNGLFYDLDEFIERDGFDMSKYDTSVIDTARAYQNQLSYFPRSFDQVTVFINVDFFEEMGLGDKIPQKKNGSWDWWTWSEMLSLCSELRTAIDAHKSANEKEYYFPLDINMAWNAVYDAIFKSFGGYTVDAENLKSGLDKANTEAYAKTVKALEFMKGLISNKYSPAYLSSLDNSAMMFLTRPSVMGCLDEGKHLAFAPLPKFDTAIDGIDENSVTYVGYGSSGYAIVGNSTKKDLAWEFIKFAVSEEGQAVISSTGSCIPTLNSLQTDDAEWTESVTDADGNAVDQSAFIYRGNTRSLATYARGVNTAQEYSIYGKMNQNLCDQLRKNSASETANYLYGQIKEYIRK